MFDVSTLMPKVLPETRIYWDGVNAGRLMLPRCMSCKEYFFPPAPVCPYCGARETEWREATGKATLYSFTIASQPWPTWGIEGPMSVAMVELEEGPRLVSTVVDCEQTPSALRLGMPLRACFRDYAGKMKVLAFRPDQDEGSAT